MKSFRLIIEPIVLAVALALVVRGFVHLYTVPSTSMAPTLTPGDHIIVTPYASGAQPQRGDVIVFRRGDTTFVKRVIAAQGDLIEARLGRVIVGGHALAEPYVAQQAATGAIDAQIIPHDCYFVMGDNRATSLDSRSWGVLPRSAVVGRVRMVLWSSPAAAMAHAHEAGLRLFRPIG